MPLSARLNLVLASLAAVSTSQALTPQQVAEALQVPAGQSWSIIPANSSYWSSDSSSLVIGDCPAGTKHAVETTLTGPGVASLNCGPNFGLAKGSLWIDGVRSEPNFSPYAYSLQRAMVGEGSHVIRWELERTTQSNSPTTTVGGFKQAGWEAYSVLSLSVGTSAASGVTLSSSGANPWIGQDRWHHGDGGAAWSGVRSDVATRATDSSLRASFQGPGVLTHFIRIRGAGENSFKLDDQAPSYFYETDWTRLRKVVGPGAHTAEWKSSVSASTSVRQSVEMMIDEVGIQPLVPLSTALDTPGRTWTATAEEATAQIPYGISDTGANGGAMVVMDRSTKLTTTVTSPCLAKVRWRGSSLNVWAQNSYLSSKDVQQPDLPNGWKDSVWDLPSGISEISFIGYSGTEVDLVEFIAPPPSVARALRIPETRLTTGGAGSWQVVSFPPLAGYGAAITTSRGGYDSWLEMPVSGPAELTFSWKADEGSLQLDGQEIEKISSYTFDSKKVRIEIPSGNHQLRWLSRAPDSTSFRSSHLMGLFGIKLSSSPIDGRARAAIGHPGALSIPEDADILEGQGHDGGDALAFSSALDNSSYGGKRVRLHLTGPGFISFWWYTMAPTPVAIAANLQFQQVAAGSSPLIYKTPYDTPGWKRETLWIPPGDGLWEWYGYGEPTALSQSRLDDLQFIPSITTSLGEALDSPALTWTNDTDRPWTGLELNPDHPGDDLALSPSLTNGDSSRFTTVVNGPGKISFKWVKPEPGSVTGQFLIDGVLKHETRWSGTGETVEFSVPITGCTLEWVANSDAWRSQPDGQIGVDQVVWTPSPVVPLDQALDAPSSVRWTTSTELPFTGHPDSGAVGESSAYTAVQAGKESWLEATVNGPGQFDFFLRGAEGSDFSYNPWRYWSVSVDGKPVSIWGNVWPPLWITGDGPHVIRLTLRLPEDEGQPWIAGAVDHVSWLPLKQASLTEASGLLTSRWTMDQRGSAEGFKDASPIGGPCLVMRAVADRERWLETRIMGPCSLSWKSSLVTSNPNQRPLVSIVIDGGSKLPIDEHFWQTSVLSLPAGAHTIRWEIKPSPWEDPPSGPDAPFAFGSVLRIGEMAITRGLSPLAATVGFPGLYALETAAEPGGPVNAAGGRVWKFGPHSTLFIFQPKLVGALTTRWRTAGTPSGYFRHEDQDYNLQSLNSDDGSWKELITAAGPGSYSRLTYSASVPGSTDNRPELGGMTFSGSKAVSLNLALDTNARFDADNWVGRVDRQAKSGGDAAWSLLTKTRSRHSMLGVIQGPARVTAWWRKTGSGSLGLKLDGAYLPLPATGGSWTPIEFVINAGQHYVQWVHDSDDVNPGSPLGEAWVDKVTVTRATAPDLVKAATLAGTGLSFTNQPDGQAPAAWHPASYREADGTWTEAIRCQSGATTLSTQVTGPAVIRFRSRCFRGNPVPEATTARSVIVVIGGGNDPQPVGDFLSVEVDGAPKLRVASVPSTGWNEEGLQVPAGTHTVTFQLKTLYSNFFGESIGTETAADLQGWIDHLRIVTPQAHFAEWATRFGLSGNNATDTADADHDGTSNALEYAFGTDPANPLAKPPAVRLLNEPGRFSLQGPLLELPYISPHVSGVLESSEDLSHWEIHPSPLLRFPPLRSSFSTQRYDNFTYTVPYDSSAGRKFYRVRFF